jgi:hypothetical protein
MTGSYAGDGDIPAIIDGCTVEFSVIDARSTRRDNQGEGGAWFGQSRSLPACYLTENARMAQRIPSPFRPPRPKVEFHPKAPDTDEESFRALAGIIVLKGPVPSTKFLEEDAERQ